MSTKEAVKRKGVLATYPEAQEQHLSIDQVTTLSGRDPKFFDNAHKSRSYGAEAEIGEKDEEGYCSHCRVFPPWTPCL